MTAERHPESFCHECGGPNVSWFSTEWAQLTGWGHNGVLCMTCFANRDPSTVWQLERPAAISEDLTARLADLLGVVGPFDEDEAGRVARCVLSWLQGVSPDALRGAVPPQPDPPRPLKNCPFYGEHAAHEWPDVAADVTGTGRVLPKVCSGRAGAGRALPVQENTP